MPRLEGPPWAVRTVYEDGRFTVIWHARCGLMAHDRETGVHLWGSRCAWSLLIAIWSEGRELREPPRSLLPDIKALAEAIDEAEAARRRPPYAWQVYMAAALVR